MKQKIIALLIVILTISINAFGQAEKFAETIKADEMKSLLYTYASDAFEGRETGQTGQKIAVNFLRGFYFGAQIPAAKGTDNYFQPMSLDFKGYRFGEQRPDKKVKSENVAAIIEGSEFPNEYLIISSHLDHIGINKEGEINNGADDDGSGNIALLEIAQAFQTAAENGQRPKRSIIFLHVTGEEKGLLGSSYYVENPLYPLENTFANLNIDMVGRIDPEREDKDPNYIYLIGSDKLSTELHELSEEVNEKHTQLALDYTYNAEDDPNRFYYRSDHYNFAKNNIPVIFYFNGVHPDYHQPTDTPDKIEYELLEKRAKLIFYTAWELVNREKKVEVDKKP